MLYQDLTKHHVIVWAQEQAGPCFRGRKPQQQQTNTPRSPLFHYHNENGGPSQVSSMKLDVVSTLASYVRAFIALCTYKVSLSML